MEDESSYMGFNIGQVLFGTLRVLKQKGLLQEAEILDVLWDAKNPMFPWNKQEIKELIKL
jgi:hypothetical protein